MWKATVGHNVHENRKFDAESDDWETDPDFINDVTEEEQRWGSKTVEGSGRTAAAINIQELRSSVAKDDAEFKKKTLESGPKASFGYGGKFGVQEDRMDKSAVGHDYIAKVEKHASQTDAVRGFGGKYGVQADRQDKSAVGWDHHERLNKHASQKDYASGFGGKYGIQADRVDKSAVGWDYIEKTEKHESQKDYAKGFGGKYGVEKEKQDKSAVGWEYHEQTEKHPSQKDYSKGFGGKYGVQEDRKDKSAYGYDSAAIENQSSNVKNNFRKFSAGEEKITNVFNIKSEVECLSKQKPEIESSAKTSNLRARFENMAKAEEEEAKKKAEEEREKRLLREKREKEVAKKDEEERQRKLSILEDEGDDEQKSSVVTPTVRTSVAVPTPLLQAATARNPSPESSSYITATTQPPTQFKDDPETHSTTAVTSSEFKDKRVTDIDSFDSDMFDSSSQTYNEPAYEILEKVEEEPEQPLETSELSAIALYDYQAADSDEISFDPDDVITNIEMIDEGWWRGECRGQVGLFPANYVQLL